MIGDRERESRDRRIVGLYLQKRLPAGAIAAKVGVSPSRVQQILTDRGVLLRTNWRSKENPKHRARNDRIVRMYDRENLSTTQIAQRLGGITPSGVMYVLRIRGVPRKPNGFFPKPPPKSYAKHRAYAESIANVVGSGPGFSAAELARKAGFKEATLRIHLRALGVWMRSGVSRKAGGRLNIEQVKKIKAAIAKGTATQQQLARRYKVGNSTIWAIASGESWLDVPWPTR